MNFDTVSCLSNSKAETSKPDRAESRIHYIYQWDAYCLSLHHWEFDDLPQLLGPYHPPGDLVGEKGKDIILILYKRDGARLVSVDYITFCFLDVMSAASSQERLCVPNQWKLDFEFTILWQATI